MKDFPDNRWLKLAGSFLFAGLVLLLVYSARGVLYPFVIAFFIAYLFDPITDFLESKGMSRNLAVILLFFVGFIFLLVLLLFLAPLVMAQVESLTNSIPKYISVLSEKLRPLLEQVNLGSREKIENQAAELLTAFGDLPIKIARSVSGWFLSRISNVIGMLVVVINLLIIPVASFYLLRDFDIIINKIKSAVPPRFLPKVIDLTKRIDAVLSGFVRGQMIVASITAFLLSAGLFAIGTPMGIVIGLVAGIAGVVPYLAIIVGLIPALVMTYLSSVSFADLFLVLLLFGAVQAIEGFVVSPKVLEKAVGLHPVAVMVSLVIGGLFFGFIGILLAVPVAAIIKVGFSDLYNSYRQSEFYNSDD